MPRVRTFRGNQAPLRREHRNLCSSLAPVLVFLAAVTRAASYVMPPLAGLCTGDAGVGVGCGFDAAFMTALGLLGPAPPGGATACSRATE